MQEQVAEGGDDGQNMSKSRKQGQYRPYNIVAAYLFGDAAVSLDSLSRKCFGRFHQQKKGVQYKHSVYAVLEPRVLNDLAQPLPEAAVVQI